MYLGVYRSYLPTVSHYWRPKKLFDIDLLSGLLRLHSILEKKPKRIKSSVENRAREDATFNSLLRKMPNKTVPQCIDGIFIHFFFRSVLKCNFMRKLFIPYLFLIKLDFSITSLSIFRTCNGKI